MADVKVQMLRTAAEAVEAVVAGPAVAVDGKKEKSQSVFFDINGSVFAISMIWSAALPLLSCAPLSMS